MPYRSGYWFGFTLIEAIVVLAVVGVLVGIGGVLLRPSPSRLLANDVKAQFQQARFEAVKRNRPIAVVWIEDEARFETRASTDAAMDADACDGSVVLNTKAVSDYGRVSVSTDMERDGLIWLPNGQARTCDGGFDIGSEILLVDSRSTRVVTVSLAGKVAVE